ncbi:MAG: GNAT family N-acetyltransferase [Desulfobacterales bacterium]|nr:GNAT family N-acetyltransferase [Desulfobacterales bacterium]
MHHDRYPKEVILKTGDEVILRPLEREDKEKFMAFAREIPYLERWYLKESPDEPEVVEKWIHNQESGKTFCVVAEQGDRIVAHASLLRRLKGGRKHVGRFRIMVSPDFRNKQLGTWMVFDIIRRAMDMNLERIRVDLVRRVEDGAIRALEKLDFVKEGLLRDYMRDDDGNYYDYQIMVKRLHKEWTDF